jgi:hypothetical protein
MSVLTWIPRIAELKEAIPMPKSRTSSRKETQKKTPLQLSVKLPKRVQAKFLIIYELEGCQKAVNFLTKYYEVRKMKIVLDGKKVGNNYWGFYEKNTAYLNSQ